MWELDSKESWVPKNWFFWPVVLEKTLRVPWTARKSNQSILKEISPGCSLEGLMLRLKLQYFGYLMLRADSFEKSLIMGKIEGRRRRGRQRMRWLDGITDLMDMSLSKLGVGDGQGGLARCSPWGRKESDTTERLNWTKCKMASFFSSLLLKDSSHKGTSVDTKSPAPLTSGLGDLNKKGYFSLLNWLIQSHSIYIFKSSFYC